MKLISDDRCRLTSQELFKPNTPYDAQRKPDGTIRLMELVEKEVPIVRPFRTKEGFLMLPNKLDRGLVAAAIRADRDAR